MCVANFIKNLLFYENIDNINYDRIKNLIKIAGENNYIYYSFYSSTLFIKTVIFKRVF